MNRYCSDKHTHTPSRSEACPRPRVGVPRRESDLCNFWKRVQGPIWPASILIISSELGLAQSEIAFRNTFNTKGPWPLIPWTFHFFSERTIKSHHHQSLSPTEARGRFWKMALKTDFEILELYFTTRTEGRCTVQQKAVVQRPLVYSWGC